MAKVTTNEELQRDQTTGKDSLNTSLGNSSSEISDNSLLTESTVALANGQTSDALLLEAARNRRDNTAQDRKEDRTKDQQLENVLYAQEADQQAQVAQNSTTAQRLARINTNREDQTSRSVLEFELQQEKERELARVTRDVTGEDPFIAPFDDIPLEVLQEVGDSSNQSEIRKQQERQALLQKVAERNFENPATEPAPDSQLNLARAEIDMLVKEHVREELYRENTDKRESSFLNTLEALDPDPEQPIFTPEQRQELGLHYFSEFQRLNGEREQVLQGYKRQSLELASSHALNSGNSTNPEERLDFMIERLETEARKENITLSEKEKQDLRTTYNQQLTQEVSTRSLRDDALTAQINNDINRMVLNQAKLPAEELQTDKNVNKILTTYGSRLTPELQDHIEKTYANRLNEVRSEELLNVTRTLAAQTAEVDLGRRDASTLTATQSLQKRYSDVQIDRQRLNNAYEVAYKDRKEVVRETMSWRERTIADIRLASRTPMQGIRNTMSALSKVAEVPLTAAAAPFMLSYKAYEAMKNTEAGRVAAQVVGGMCRIAYNGVKHCVQNPRQAGGALLGFGNSVLDSMGITYIAKGITGIATTPFKIAYQTGKTGFDFVKDTYGVATGKTSLRELAQNLGKNTLQLASLPIDAAKSVGRLAWGGVKLAGEVTGVTDVVLAGKYALQGDWTMAALHGGFAIASASSLAATIATGGAAAPTMFAVAAGRTTMKQAAKQVVKAGAKEFLEKAGKELSQEFLEKVGSEVVQETVEQTVEKGFKEIAEQVMKQGREMLSPAAMEAIFKEFGQEPFETMLREGLELNKFVADQVEELLDMGLKNPRQLAKRLEELDITGEAAEKVLKEVQETMRVGIKNPLMESGIKDTLEEAISKPIAEALQTAAEKDFKEQLKKQFLRVTSGGAEGAAEEALGKALKENAQQAGKQLSSYMDELVEAAWKGQKEAIETATRKVTREGIDEAFKRIKARPDLPGGGGHLDNEDLRNPTLARLSERELTEQALEQSIDPAKLEEALPESTRIRVISNNGELFQVTELFDGDRQKWIAVHQTRLNEDQEEASSTT